MLEILALIWLSKKVRRTVEDKGYKGGGYVAMTIAMWVGFEILGVIIGMVMTEGEGGILVALVALGMGILGGFIAYNIAKSKPTKNMVSAEPTQEA